MGNCNSCKTVENKTEMDTSKAEANGQNNDSTKQHSCPFLQKFDYETFYKDLAIQKKSESSLSEKTIEIVKLTIPILEEKMIEISTHFYETYIIPLDLKIFSQKNQDSGRQAQALAGAVVAYAKNIENLELLAPYIEIIGHKHVSLGVQANQYPIVGDCLIKSIKDILQDGATEEVLEAWTQAYQYLADMFIKVEEQMYSQNKSKTGGWEGLREFKVEKHEFENNCKDVLSLYLKPVDGEKLPLFTPGQYLTVKIDLPEFGEVWRHYSLSDSPNQDHYRISVKKIEGEMHASEYICNSIRETSILHCKHPQGAFCYKENQENVVLIGAGIGLTPLLSMAKTITNKNIFYIHVTQTEETHIMEYETKKLEKSNQKFKSFVCYTQETETNIKFENIHFGHLNAQIIKKWVNPETSDFYFCGPIMFMKSIKTYLSELNVPEDRQFFEYYGPFRFN